MGFDYKIFEKIIHNHKNIIFILIIFEILPILFILSINLSNIFKILLFFIFILKNILFIFLHFYKKQDEIKSEFIEKVLGERIFRWKTLAIILLADILFIFLNSLILYFVEIRPIIPFTISYFALLPGFLIYLLFFSGKNDNCPNQNFEILKFIFEKILFFLLLIISIIPNILILFLLFILATWQH